MARDTAIVAKFSGPAGQEDMPYLMSPGPVTTPRRVKLAMLADYAPNDVEFTAMTAQVQTELLRIAGSSARHDCVLVQGPGMFAVEAALGSFAPARRKKTLILVNGRHGQLAHEILQKMGRPLVMFEGQHARAFTSGEVDDVLALDADISHVWAVQCEASSGVVNPIAEIAALVKARGKVMMVDAIAGLGALPLDLSSNIDVLVSTSGNCLESVPGISFVLADKQLLAASEGKAPSFSLDLYANWKGMISNGQFRLTPSTHAIAALNEALVVLEQEGGVGARHQRYCDFSNQLQTRMSAMGFVPLLANATDHPIVQTYYAPRDPNYNFDEFSAALRAHGFLIAPGAVDNVSTLRVSLMGQTVLHTIESFCDAVISVLQSKDIRELRPTT